MHFVWTAFLLGLVGSVHCAVMCGPLMMAVTCAQRTGHSFLIKRIAYHAGRLTIYAAIGALFGAIGQTFALAGMQRGLSIAAGAALLGGLLLSSRVAIKAPVARLVMKLKTAFGKLLQRPTLFSQFSLGALNGLLPCGLVYVAAASAATTLDPLAGGLHMIAFGAGTLPMLLGVTIIGAKLRLPLVYVQKLIPISIAAIAIFLLLRGMALGIPYLSPSLTVASLHHCH